MQPQSLFSRFFALLVTLTSLLPSSLAADSTPQTIKLGYTFLPYSSQEPEFLAELGFSLPQEDLLAPDFSTRKWTWPPTAASSDIQLGILSSSGKAFHGSTIHVSKELLLSPNAQFRLHVDPRTETVWSVSVIKQVAGSVDGQSPPVIANVVFVQDAAPPMVAVNKPVVLTEEGKVQEPPPEKTLFQKYWWVLLAIGFVAMSGGGGGDGK